MTRHALVAVALALTLLVAGCAGTTGQSTTASSDATTTSTEATAAAGTATTTEQSTEATATETAATTTPTATTTPAGDGTESAANETGDDEGSAGAGVDADALAAAGASSLASADGVVVEGNLAREVRTSSGSTTVAVAFTERDDVAARELAVERTVTARGQTVETATYLVNGTLYERNPGYERQYGTEWVRVDATNGTWTNASSTAVVTRLVNASDASVAGNATVDGERAVVLDLDVDEGELATLSGYEIDADDLNALSGTVTVDAESGRVYAATVHINRTVENRYGQEVTVVTDVTREFTEYGPVTVELPDGGEDATPINGTQA